MTALRAFAELRSALIAAPRAQSLRTPSRKRLCVRCASSDTQQAQAPRLRFAPSPTGFLHLGGLRSALFNHLLARKLGGAWILRIEDTDRNRFVEGAADSLTEILQWARLDYDEGPSRGGPHAPYTQSERKQIYARYAEELVSAGHAYACFCDPPIASAQSKHAPPNVCSGECAQLSSDALAAKSSCKAPAAIRLKIGPEGLPRSFEDLVYGKINLPAKAGQDRDFVIIKRDGFPTYHFANVIDDHLMQITHVLRGEEWIPSTSKHLAIYDAFGWQAPRYAHMPILVTSEGKKLSKRSGHVRVEDYRAEGYEPEAVLNAVALLGASWQDAPPESRYGLQTSDIMTMQEMISKFAIENVNKHRSAFSPGQLDFLNRHHLILKCASDGTLTEMAERLLPDLQEAFPSSPLMEIAYIKDVIVALKERINRLKDVAIMGPYFFSEPDYTVPAAKAMLRKTSEEHYRSACEATYERLSSMTPAEWTADRLSAALAAVTQDEPGLQIGLPLRHALTAAKIGPPVAIVMATLGQETSLARLERAAHTKWTTPAEDRLAQILASCDTKQAKGVQKKVHVLRARGP
ncbi:uncharacterized protein L969DRAFT_104259 [Mixia osmundae IAM 14324]|uniref:Glutamate--tRNA ligase, mitochondrial n=1 Tax=Mixia osmundae (strain CBS 9802 / IAM 14324 / JCM 22182 / KY 12970) TaxID=764103 RepID=G7E7H5_MIXOS|nr:uncharacterized protein L969DRAFT_104259 [Mixia osmundae IAM 14324]KEI38388.1 hypothetical protein L969DRAFT_104259 [Mixia osmundae IAM 14324]GAA98785.1 hypothetical protein E5Q_05473 [Mixia osmundae IAM 14324]